MKQKKISIFLSLLCMLLTSGCQSNEPGSIVSSKTAEETVTITSLDDIYRHPASQQYPDIRDLPAEYSKEDAKYDSCFVLGAMVFNEDLYYTFMDQYEEGVSSFIRVVEANQEGEAIITDVLYDETTDLVYVVSDQTRDTGIAEDERVITYRTYENVGTWKAKHEYWVAYNGTLPDTEDTDPGNLWIITTIN